MLLSKEYNAFYLSSLGKGEKIGSVISCFRWKEHTTFGRKGRLEQSTTSTLWKEEDVS